MYYIAQEMEPGYADGTIQIINTYGDDHDVVADLPRILGEFDYSTKPNMPILSQDILQLIAAAFARGQERGVHQGKQILAEELRRLIGLQ